MSSILSRLKIHHQIPWPLCITWFFVPYGELGLAPKDSALVGAAYTQGGVNNLDALNLAAADGELWLLHYTSVPTADGMAKMVRDALEKVFLWPSKVRYVIFLH